MSGVKGRSGGPRIPRPGKKLGRPTNLHKVKQIRLYLHYPQNMMEQATLEWLQAIEPKDRLAEIARLKLPKNQR